MRYAVQFTNLDVLATVVSGRSWLRLVPPALFLLALALAARRARAAAGRANVPEGARDGDPGHRHVPLDAGQGRPADEARRRAGGRSHLPRPGAGPACASGSSCSRARRRSRLRRRGTTSSCERPSTRSTRSSSSAEPRSATRCETAVELGRQVEDEPPAGKEIVCRAPDRLTRTLAQAGGVRRGRAPCRSSSSRTARRPGASCSRSRGRRSPRRRASPSTRSRSGRPNGVIDRGPFGFGFPGSGGDQRIPVPPDPETLRRSPR